MINKLQKEKIKELYYKKISLTKIGKLTNISRQWISKYLKNENLEIINYQNISKFNINYFNKVDTEEKAYWLGFLYADGSVSKDNNSIELSLGLKDYNHLLKYKKSLNSELKVKKDHFRYRLTLTNKEFKKDLIKLGCIPNKSLILNFPNYNQVPKKLIKHFLRGYFDGDGHIRYTNNSNRPLFTLLGTKNFLESIIELIDLPYNLKKDKRHKNNTYFISYYGKNSMKFLNFIYSDCNIYLDRKYEIYKNSFAVQERNLLNN